MSRHDDEIASDTSGDDFELFPVDTHCPDCGDPWDLDECWRMRNGGTP